MIQRYTHESLTWIDIESPTQEEIRGLMEEFGIDPFVAEEVLTPTLRPRMDVRDTYFYLILHFPALKHTHGHLTEQEVDFVVGKDWIITTRYDTIDPLHQFSKMFEVDSILGKHNIGAHAGSMFFFMMTTLYASLSDEIEYLGDRLEEAESNIFDGHEKEMVIELSHIGRDLLNLKQALGPHRHMLDALFGATEPFFGIRFAREVRLIIGEYLHVWNSVESCGASLSELRETNNGLLTTKQNEVTKMFTILAFLTLPMTLIASLFGMNTQHTPISGDPNDFWIIASIMMLTGSFFYLYFRYKRWL